MIPIGRMRARTQKAWETHAPRRGRFFGSSGRLFPVGGATDSCLVARKPDTARDVTEHSGAGRQRCPLPPSLGEYDVCPPPPPGHSVIGARAMCKVEVEVGELRGWARLQQRS